MKYALLTLFASFFLASVAIADKSDNTSGGNQSAEAPHEYVEPVDPTDTRVDTTQNREAHDQNKDVKDPGGKH